MMLPYIMTIMIIVQVRCPININYINNNYVQGFAQAAGPLAVGLLVFRSLVSVFLDASPCAGSLASGY